MVLFTSIPSKSIQEYVRQTVTVFPLNPAQPLSVAAADDGIVFEPIILPAEDISPTKGKQAHVYVWNKYPVTDTLEPQIWSYETFVKDNLHRWIGGDAVRFTYLDVDNKRETIMGKVTAPDQPVDLTSNQVTNIEGEYLFGHDMRKHFCFDKGYVNLNHGMVCIFLYLSTLTHILCILCT